MFHIYVNVYQMENPIPKKSMIYSHSHYIPITIQLLGYLHSWNPPSVRSPRRPGGLKPPAARCKRSNGATSPRTASTDTWRLRVVQWDKFSTKHGKIIGNHGKSWENMGKYGKIIGNHGKIMGKYTIYMEELLKRCHKPPMTGNGKHTTYKNGDDWVMIYYCFTHIITHGFEWYVNYPVTKKNWMRCNNISDMSLRYVDGIDWTIHCCSSQGNLSLSRAIGQQLRWLRFQHPETLSFFTSRDCFFLW